jgi:glycosyltransferase involved in cell wall biosynthesis
MANESLKELKAAEYDKDLQPTVSIVMIAYNLEKYLDAAVESVLIQQTNFKVELIIGEDCSTDNTRAIALKYQQKYPHLIKVLLPKKNQGLTPNCVATHNACIGKYIALLDGDDYWTNPLKLQKQIDFLESHPEYSGHAHQSMKIFDDGSSEPIPFGEDIDTDYFLKDTITHRKFHTSALTYRKTIWDKVGGIPSGISSNERAIYPMVALFGKIHYSKESMCVYRITGFGLASRVNYKELESDLIMIPWLKKIDRNFPARKFTAFLHLCIYTYGSKKIPFAPLLKHYFLFSINSFSYFPKNLGDLKWATVFFFKRIFK